MATVWCVDDDEEMSRAVSLMLKLLNFNTRTFRNAKSAARTLLAGERPTLMILDINMPQVSGIELLTFIRQRREWDNLPIIMLSSEATDEQIDQAIAIGADSYITKPVMIDELEQAIKQALKKRGSSTALTS